MKTIQDCIKFSNDNPVCYIATVENDQPRVRAMGFWFADESGFYFQTSEVKEIPNQLRSNPKMEVCFFNQENNMGVMLRVAGKTEFIEDKNMKERVINDRPFLKNFGLTPESDDLVIFKIPHGEAHFWTMENNLKPKEIIKF